jgi:hypothetical protein
MPSDCLNLRQHTPRSRVEERPMRSPAWFSIALLVVGGCYGFGDAARERVERPLRGQRETLSLACPALAVPGSATPASLRVGATRDVSGQGERIGRLYAPDPDLGIALFLADGLVIERLERDVEAVLAEAGVEAAENPPNLELELRLAWVASDSAAWNQLRGTIRAAVSWRARLVDPRDGRTRWQADFEREASRQVVYFLASDHEAALAEAWCGALEALAAATAINDFRAALEGW